MYNQHPRFRYSPVSLCVSLVAVLSVTYFGLIAVVMSYAALTVEFSQSVRNDESTVAVLESTYLDTVAKITSTDYSAQGYAVPRIKVFVPTKNVAVLR